MAQVFIGGSAGAGAANLDPNAEAAGEQLPCGWPGERGWGRFVLRSRYRSPGIPKTIVFYGLYRKNPCFPKAFKEQQKGNHFFNGLGSLGVGNVFFNCVWFHFFEHQTKGSGYT